MAYLMSEGLNPLNPPQRATCVASFPDWQQTEAVAALCYLGAYQELIENTAYDPEDENSPIMVPNPEGPGEFSMRRVMTWIQSQVHEYRRIKATELVAQTVVEDAQQVQITSAIVVEEEPPQTTPEPA